MYCTYTKCSTLFCVQISVIDSARQHGITDEEIRSVVSFPAFRFRLVPRRLGSLPYAYIGGVSNEPLIEVFADSAPVGELVVFHAMLLRMSTVQAAGLEAVIPADRIAQRQRPQRTKEDGFDGTVV